MAISYVEIKSPVALRAAQLAGTSSATLEAAYTAFTLDGAEAPASAIKNAILNTESSIAEVIANNAAHPYRSYLYARTVDLADLDGTPTESQSGDPIIGVWDSVADSDTNAPLTLQPTQTIADINGNTYFSDTDFFYYNLTGNQLRHTRPLAYLQGCSWNRETQDTAYDADGDSPLPPPLTNLWIAGTLANLAQVGWSDGAGALPYYSGIYASGMQMLEKGAISNIPLASMNVVAG